jgi:diaminopimelate epimerase
VFAEITPALTGRVRQQAKTMRFTKMHGCGNDYIYVDCVRAKPPRDPVALARVISDRHFGVGGDGLILICPSEKADARMRMFNADGSEAEMCGNGLRCVAKFVHDHGIAAKPRLTIETGRGVLAVDLEVHQGKVERVTVDMGEPILQASDIPTTLPGNPPVDAALTIDGTTLKFTCVSMGNPHAITFVDAITDRHVHQLGPIVETHAAFPRKTNVEFIKVNRPDDATMRVWERGSGETLACGTGACASAVAGVLTSRLARKVTMHLVEVFRGEWPD